MIFFKGILEILLLSWLLRNQIKFSFIHHDLLASLLCLLSPEILFVAISIFFFY